MVKPVYPPTTSLRGGIKMHTVTHKLQAESCKENSYQVTISLNMWIMRRSFHFQPISYKAYM